MFTKHQPHQDEVIQEFPMVGKYRVRLLRIGAGVALDIREYVQGGSFEGFTRRGARLTSAAEVELLRNALGHAIDGMKAK